MADEKKKPVVAYLGPEGSYTHQAALSAFPPQDDTPTATLTPLVTIEDVFSAVQSGTAHRGVVPFENSSNGSVVFTLDLFADTQSKYPDILVCSEAYVAVRHCLLGYSNPSKTSATPPPAPSSSSSSSQVTQGNKQQQQQQQQNEPTWDLSHIRRLYSHPQAWGQCKNFLTTYLKSAERHDVSSTSKAAEVAAADPSGTSAALSSIVAADLFGLDVLAEGINDKLGNTTRFLVLKRRQSSSSSSQDNGEKGETGYNDDNNNEADSTSWKSLITFTVEHANPGSLANCLSVFARQGINLTSINTRPSGVRNWDYVFFVEFRGRKNVDEGRGGEGDGAVNRALDELKGVCSGYRWLGSWENRLE